MGPSLRRPRLPPPVFYHGTYEKSAISPSLNRTIFNAKATKRSGDLRPAAGTAPGRAGPFILAGDAALLRCAPGGSGLVL